MEHAQGILSKREQTRVDTSEGVGCQLNDGTRKLLGIVTVTALSEKLRRAGKIAVVAGVLATGMGGAERAMAGEAERKTNLAVLFAGVTQLAAKAQDGLTFGEILQTGMTGVGVRAITATGVEGGASAIGAWGQVDQGVESLFGLAGGTQRNIAGATPPGSEYAQSPPRGSKAEHQR
jgi:hypothetical protein